MPLLQLKLVNPKPKQINASGWNDLISRLSSLHGHWQHGEIINLVGWKTIQYKETESYVFILAELSTEPICVCGAAKSELKKNGFTRVTKILDLAIRFKITEIYFRIGRFICKQCNISFQQDVPEMFENRNFTLRLGQFIETESLYPYKSFSELSLETGVNSSTIQKIFTEYVKKLTKTRVIKTPRFLAMDETYLTNKNNIRCVITAPEEKRLFEILKDNSTETIKEWLENLPNAHLVEVVSMDMCLAYRKLVRENLPNADIVADRYHVQNILNQAVKDVISIIGKQLSVTKHRESMRRPKIILKSRHKLADFPTRDGIHVVLSEKEEAEQWTATFPFLNRAYDLKERFSDILQLGDRQEAELKFDSWLIDLDKFVVEFRSEYSKECEILNRVPFENVTVSFRDWRDQILNYIDFKYKFDIKVTSAFAERANGLIKEAFAVGKVYSYDTHRARLVFGGILKRKKCLHPLDDYSKVKGKKATKITSKAKKQPNPNSNVSQLKAAHEGENKLIDLVSDSQRKSNYDTRFMSDSTPDISSPLNVNFSNRPEDKEKPNLLIYNFDGRKFSEQTSKKRRSKVKYETPPPLFSLFEDSNDSSNSND